MEIQRDEADAADERKEVEQHVNGDSAKGGSLETKRGRDSFSESPRKKRKDDEIEENGMEVEQPAEIIGKIMTKEERETKIKNLSETLPTELKDLLTWKVKWDYLTEVIIPIEICHHMGS